MNSASTFHHGAVETKLKLAEEVLGLSNQMVQLSIEIILQGGKNIERLVKRQVEHSRKIQTLVKSIAPRLESKRERELFTAASTRWSSAVGYEQSLNALSVGAETGENGTMLSELVLPLLIDNASWRAFIELLRADLDASESDSEGTNELARRAVEFMRSNQELRSKIAERKRLDERLSQLASFIDSSTDAIIVQTLGGTIASWNIGAELLYGYTSSEILGKHARVLIPTDRWDEVSATLDTVASGEPVPLYQTIHLRKDGHPIDVSTALSPVRDTHGEVIGAAAITRNTATTRDATVFAHRNGNGRL